MCVRACVWYLLSANEADSHYYGDLVNTVRESYSAQSTEYKYNLQKVLSNTW